MMGLISAWYNQNFGYKGSIYVWVRMFCIKLLQYEQLQITMELKKNPSKCEKHSGWSLCTCFHLWCSTKDKFKRGGQKLRKNWGQKLRWQQKLETSLRLSNADYYYIVNKHNNPRMKRKRESYGSKCTLGACN